MCKCLKGVQTVSIGADIRTYFTPAEPALRVRRWRSAHVEPARVHLNTHAFAMNTLTRAALHLAQD